MESSSELVEYRSLKKYENELIECLGSTDLASLARQAAEFKIVSSVLETNLESLHTKVPHQLKCRYLFYNVYYSVTTNNKNTNSHFYDLWLKVLSRLKVTTGVLSQVKKCLDQLCNIILDPNMEKRLVFTENHIFDLTEELVDCSSRWKEIGIAFGLPQNEIENIQAINWYSPVMCLATVLAAWVTCKFPTAKPPTIDNLKGALCSKTVGRGAEAYQLMQSDFLKQLSINSYLAVDKPPENFEIISQTMNQSITGGYSILFEVQVSTPSREGVSFKWLKDEHNIDQTLLADNSFNGHHISIFS